MKTLTLTNAAADIAILEKEFNNTGMGADELKVIIAIHNIAKVSSFDVFEDKAEECLYLAFCYFLEKTEDDLMLEASLKLDLGFIFEHYLHGAKLARWREETAKHSSMDYCNQVLCKLLKGGLDENGSLKDETRITFFSLFLNTKSSASREIIE